MNIAEREISKNDFYIITHEKGFHNPSLPTWTDNLEKTQIFDKNFDTSKVKRIEIPEVPGAFQLLNVLSETETQNLINISEMLGYDEDSPVSLPHEVRHNENFNWVVSKAVDTVIWERSKHLVTENWQGQTAKGINARFRFYKYKQGDFFSPHTDGAWHGSRVIDNKLIHNAYGDLYSQYTYLLLLSEDFNGGATQFMVSKSDPTKPARLQNDMNVINVRTPRGGALCFPHGSHPLHCLHSSEEITRGTKYIIRTDILFG
jgi:predicted 2-oxoglutarate/Fe(II)-dependent dioxygenase YbiX